MVVEGADGTGADRCGEVVVKATGHVKAVGKVDVVVEIVVKVVLEEEWVWVALIEFQKSVLTLVSVDTVDGGQISWINDNAKEQKC